MAAQAYDEQLLAALRRHVLEPLARSCEADLRLHLVHFPRPIAVPLHRSSLLQARTLLLAEARCDSDFCLSYAYSDSDFCHLYAYCLLCARRRAIMQVRRR